MFRGSIVALITPFDSMGRIDARVVRKLARLHVDSGTDAILLAGCTGESFTLREGERAELFRLVKDEAGDSIKVMIGTGASATRVAVERTKSAMDIGADGALVITPFGNKPTQHALISYFREVADVGLPIVLYNVPGRTGTTIQPQAAIALAEHPNIVAIKEASGSLDTVSEILRKSSLTVLSGDDSLTVPMIALGASGVISTVANLLPADFSAMVHAALKGDFTTASEIHLRIFPVMKALFIEGNPVPLKTAMSIAGLLPDPVFRPPLAAMTENNRTKLAAVLKEYGIA